MAPIQDTTKMSVVTHSVPRTLETLNRFATLEDQDAKTHLEQLAKALYLTSRLAYEKVPESKQNNDFQRYLLRMGETLDAIVLKNNFEKEQINSDVKLSCSINPVDSGFPIFVRDFGFLENDKKKASEKLGKLPTNEKIVEETLYYLFRGLMPKDLLIKKMQRDYYEKLSGLELPSVIKSYPEVITKTEKEGNKIMYCKKSIERLDENNNIPRFYTVYFKIASRSYDKSLWQLPLELAIKDGMSTIANLELPYLAKKMEEVEELTIEMVERFDVGPFFNKYTKNKDIIQNLLEQGDFGDSIIMFRRSAVQRMGQTEKKGFKHWLKRQFIGDKLYGVFSPAIASPQYVLMPHRLIQKIHNQNLHIAENTKMYGITKEGGIVD